MGGWAIKRKKKIVYKKYPEKLCKASSAKEGYGTNWKTIPVQPDVEKNLAQKKLPNPSTPFKNIIVHSLQHHLPEEVQNVPP